jgi:hypothetical protein
MKDWKDLIDLSSIDMTNFNKMTKNDRNAGRKKVKDAVMVQAKVTAKYADEYKKLAENYREYETKKSK